MLVQMSGAPGSGKSTIARALARERGLVIIDHDVVKDAQLGAGLPFAQAGKLSYAVLLALAEDLLGQGHQVVIDSPCFYDELLEGGQAVAARTGAAYRYIECVTDDLDVLDQRLRSRAAVGEPDRRRLRRAARRLRATGRRGVPRLDRQHEAPGIGLASDRFDPADRGVCRGSAGLSRRLTCSAADGHEIATIALNRSECPVGPARNSPHQHPRGTPHSCRRIDHACAHDEPHSPPPSRSPPWRPPSFRHRPPRRRCTSPRPMRTRREPTPAATRASTPSTSC